MRDVGIVLAGGESSRFKYRDIKKQFIHVYKNVQLYEFSLQTMLQTGLFSRVYLVVPADSISDYKSMYTDHPIVKVIPSELNRFQSALLAAKFANAEFGNEQNVFLTYVDASRPLVSKKSINNVVLAAKRNAGAATLALHSSEVIALSTNEKLNQTLSKNVTINIQTPQTFRLGWMRQLIEDYSDAAFSDICSAILKYKEYSVSVVYGEPTNFSISSNYDYVRFIEEISRAKNRH
ncbi:2-C-methyl-D-erythritol 4-phosphate cytidylyltransferase [[Mycoplasma] testudinis]|uniref:2-C-methyl-D-erythritol 4-phosphate cytidylyltransferase n=1 Tax=[Mycoplasma] testudinis TaxID=33924 RepID=UPI00048A056D|nr:2-C-methyl-D-erythritol 4-phosphate cytidylyltransferase [[Mycoplasma] testudinis]